MWHSHHMILPGALTINYKHDVTCVPFQRDSPADKADYADNLIWRRLKVGNSYLLSSRANGHFWFCRSAWECFFFYWCLFVCLSAFLLLRHICVFCSTRSRREKLAFSDEYKSYSLFGVVCDWIWRSCSLCQISKKDSGVYEVVLKDDRGKDTSTLNLIDQGNLAESHAKITNYLTTVANKASQYIFSSRVQRLDEWSFQFYW